MVLPYPLQNRKRNLTIDLSCCRDSMSFLLIFVTELRSLGRQVKGIVLGSAHSHPCIPYCYQNLALARYSAQETHSFRL